ncbi:uncharacterized protein C4orf17 homolog [Octodon degus]|uniref:Uncharacterized protein C4orf17 homolog n=1 Tax=Octodon degus TaxID=10160 RepID=A0A6P6DHY7_OCTDE|nr:uncharacterized protein C4orf17 homolog [Octodon degus]
MQQGEGDPHTMAVNLGSPTSTELMSKGNHATLRSRSCFLVRHTPHPRRVCHIKGLNNIPICTVKDDEIALRTLQGGGQLCHLEKNDATAAKGSYLPSPAALESPVRGVSPAPNSVKIPPRPHSEPSRKVIECFKTSSDNPFVIKKEECKTKKLPSPPKASSAAGSSSSEESWEVLLKMEDKVHQETQHDQVLQQKSQRELAALNSFNSSSSFSKHSQQSSDSFSCFAF